MKYFSKYYTFFDAGNETVHAYIGTGEKNPDANILQRTYNRSYEDYNGDRNNWKRERTDMSEWTYTPNKYDEIVSDMRDLIIFWSCFGGIIFLAVLSYCIYCSRIRYLDYK